MHELTERDILFAHLIDGGLYGVPFTRALLVATQNAEGTWRLATQERYAASEEPECTITNEGAIVRLGRVLGHVDDLLLTALPHTGHAASQNSQEGPSISPAMAPQWHPLEHADAASRGRVFRLFGS